MDKIMSVIFIFFIVLMIGAVIFTCSLSVTECEVERFSIGCEVSHMDYAEEATSRSTTRPKYVMGVRSNELCATLEISAEQFAEFVVGDIVEVEVVIVENKIGEQRTEYNLLGKCE